ncbi:hypothetical protein R4Z10_20545 [Niallia sp. XMNu-256]|uniref:hypothetical protein n=1 Tax=Niallia sp. XMNu-256 TaxID=3082444 RepID=UPI0030CB7527
MKKIMLSILTGFILVSIVLMLNIWIYQESSSNLAFLLIMMLVVLLTPIITALIATIGQNKYNLILAGALSAFLASLITLIPFYFFSKSNTMGNFIESISTWNTGSNNTIVSVDLNLSISGFASQIIYWIVAGTITGVLVNVIRKRKLRKIG